MTSPVAAVLLIHFVTKTDNERGATRSSFTKCNPRDTVLENSSIHFKGFTEAFNKCFMGNMMVKGLLNVGIHQGIVDRDGTEAERSWVEMQSSTGTEVRTNDMFYLTILSIQQFKCSITVSGR